MFRRFTNELNLSFPLVLLVIVALVWGASFYLFQKSEYASFLIVGLQILLLLKLSNKERIDFMNTIILNKDVHSVRFLENLAVSIPLITINLIYGHWLLVVCQVLVAFGFVYVKTSALIQSASPTPFSKNPFEFISGFRRYIGYLIGCYLVFIVAFLVNNMNIGIFAMLLLWLVIFSFYSIPEDVLYVKIFNKTPKDFLKSKILIAFLQSCVLVLPMFVLLLIFNPENYLITVGLLLLGFINLIVFILAKYVELPDELGLSAGILIAMSIALPPLLIFTLAYFYKRAMHNLNDLNR